MPLYIASLVGKTFNGIKVLSIHTWGYGVRTKWLCACHCGNMFVVDGSFLKNGHTKSCGCRRSAHHDLTDLKFNKLTVLSLHSKEGVTRWNCRCDCGKECVVIGSSLKNGGTKSCGCLHKTTKRPSQDLTGKKFGMLTALEKEPTTNARNVRWKCICDCGKETYVNVGNLRTGHTKSCGCYNLAALSINKRTHGIAADHARLYSIWQSMKRRCYDSEDSTYTHYGARGISICEEWLTDGWAFVNWSIQNGYTTKLTIDRINNDGNYEPSNCRWVTKLDQLQNTSRSLGVDKVKEVKLLLKKGISNSEIAKKFQVHNSIISNISTGKTYRNVI